MLSTDTEFKSRDRFDLDAASLDALKLRGFYMSMVVIAWSLLILMGWLLDLRILKNPFTDPVPVAPSTACCFIAACASLLWSMNHRRKSFGILKIVFALGVCFTGIFISLEFAHLGDGFAQYFHSFCESDGVSGRMALATSFNFILLGIALLFCNTNDKFKLRTLSHCCLTVIACISLFTMTGYSYDLLGVKQTLPMAMPTAILFTLVVIAVFCIHPYNDYFLLFQSDSAAGRIIRQLLPIIILGPLCLGWARLLAQRAGYFETAAGSGLMSVSISGTLGVFLFLVAKSLAKSEIEKKKQEESKKILAAIIESSEDAIISKSLNGVVETWNPGAQEIFGYSAEEIVGKEGAVLFPPGKENEEIELIEKLKRGERVFHFETVRKRKDGRLIDVSLTISPIKDSNGSIVGISKIIRDISVRKKSEQALLESKRELEILNIALENARDQAMAASKLKSEFVANMSHEIRTPLNGIIGMTNILLRSKLSDKQKEYSKSIKDSSKALMTIVDDVLDFSKIEAGKLQLELIEFNLLALIEGVCAILLEQARAKKLSLKTEFDPVLPRFVRGDPGRIRQVLMNMLSNAIKFSHQGTVTVKVSVESRSDTNLQIRFAVSDQGIGLMEEEKELLFQPFVQADGSISRRFGGTGLGLSICKRLVELMNGNIGVESLKGDGSTFWFAIPLETQASQSIESNQNSGDNHAIVSSQGLILVAEDHAVNQQVVRIHLEEMGLDCNIVSTGVEVLEALRIHEYALILMDCQMPDMDGYRTTTLIRQNESSSGGHIPIIAMTANAMAGDRERCIAAGMDDYLSKPIDSQQFSSMILKWLPTQAKPARNGPIDLEALNKRYSNNAHRTLLLATYKKEVPDLVKSILSYRETKDANALLKHVHGLKGISATVFANEMKAICIDVETTVREENFQMVESLVEKLEQEYEAIELCLEALA
ncbi:MAG: PAS domain S-box protein [Candidatus Melainabacteria bacterium]|nr:PAS domain S-box protein [Candidatus Melainabacteria bacterium]